jgi:hypothetical protein
MIEIFSIYKTLVVKKYILYQKRNLNLFRLQSDVNDAHDHDKLLSFHFANWTQGCVSSILK